MSHAAPTLRPQGDVRGTSEADVTSAGLTGSALLLQKLPIMIEAHRQLELDPRDATAECNTLAYGPAAYPLLALLRQCDSMQRAVGGIEDKGGAIGAAAVQGGVTAGSVDDTSSLFAGINAALSYPQDRRWSDGLTSRADASALRARKALMTWFRRQAALLDDAVALPTAREVLEPAFVGLDTVLSPPHDRRDVRRRPREPGTTASARHDSSSSDRQSDAGEDDAEDVSNIDDDTSDGVDDLFDLDASERRGGGTAHEVRSGALSEAHDGQYGHNLAHLNRLCAEERLLLRAVRRPLSPLPLVGGSAAVTAAVVANAAAVTAAQQRDTVVVRAGGHAYKDDLSPVAMQATSRAMPPSQWGPRMLALLRHGELAVDHGDLGRGAAVAGRRAGGGVVTVWGQGVAAMPAHPRSREEQSRVAAYLKRVAWVEQQGRAQAQTAGSAAVPGGQASWQSLSEAERVQREMTHTHAQRRRFRRTRRHTSDDDDAAEDT